MGVRHEREGAREGRKCDSSRVESALKGIQRDPLAGWLESDRPSSQYRKESGSSLEFREL